MFVTFLKFLLCSKIKDAISFEIFTSTQSPLTSKPSNDFPVDLKYSTKLDKFTFSRDLTKLIFNSFISFKTLVKINNPMNSPSAQSSGISFLV